MYESMLVYGTSMLFRVFQIIQLKACWVLERALISIARFIFVSAKK